LKHGLKVRRIACRCKMKRNLFVAIFIGFPGSRNGFKIHIRGNTVPLTELTGVLAIFPPVKQFIIKNINLKKYYGRNLE
jgi:hypothetical protein